MGENNYLILLGADAYDVPHRGKDGRGRPGCLRRGVPLLRLLRLPGEGWDAGAGILPWGERVPHLYGEADRGPAGAWLLFPAFDDRTANLSNALFYSRKPDELHQEFIDAVFRMQSRPCPPPSSGDLSVRPVRHSGGRAAWRWCSLSTTTCASGSRTTGEPGPGAAGCHRRRGERRAAELRRAGGAGGGVPNRLRPVLWRGGATPANLIDAKHFAVKTADATIQVDPGELSGGGPDHRRTALPAGPGGRECGGQRSGGPDCRRQRRRRDYINREEGIC